ncbi:MAG: hypothetical protein ACRDPO_23675 [Streptosporangiaceae bacterium]
MRSRVWPGVLARVNGRAPSSRSLIQSSRVVVSSPREQNTPRPGQRRRSPASHRSTWLIHQEQAAVKRSPD